MLNTRSLSTVRNFYPVIVISLCACYVFYKLLLQTYPSIITQELMSSFQISAAGLGNLAATFYYTYMIAQLFVGFLLDKYGIRWLTALAIFACALGVTLFSQAQTLLAAELSRALMGLGVAFATVSYMKLASVLFHSRHYAFVNGLLATAAMAGAVFGQAPLSFLVHEHGWRNSLGIVGIIGFVIAILFTLAVASSKLQPVSDDKNKISLKDIVQIFKNKQNWLLTLYGGFAFCPLAVFGGLWGNPFLQEAYHLTKIETASMMSLIFISFGIGSPLLGILSDRLNNRRTVMLIGTAIACLSICTILYCPLPHWLLEIMLCIFGFSLGVYMLVFTMGKESNPIFLTASVIAMVNASDAILDSLTEPAIGKLLDLGWSGTLVDGVHYFSLSNYRYALAVIPVYLFAAVISLIWVKEKSK